MNFRRIVAIVLGIAALISFLSQLGLLAAVGLSEYPWWLIWPLTIFGFIGAVMLWFLGEQSHDASAASTTTNTTSVDGVHVLSFTSDPGIALCVH